MNLEDLVKQDTKTVEPPSGTPDPLAKAPEEKKPEEKKAEAVSTVEKKDDVLSDEQTYEAVGEINADLFAICVEVPCYIINSLMGAKKKKEAKRKFKGDDLAKRLAEITAWKKENNEVIEFKSKELDRMKAVYTKIAKLQKQTKPNDNLFIGANLVKAISKRTEIFFE